LLLKEYSYRSITVVCHAMPFVFSAGRINRSFTLVECHAAAHQSTGGW